MKVLNKTNQIQEITVKDRVKLGHSYSMYIMAGKTLDVDYTLSIVGMNDLIDKGIIAILPEGNTTEDVKVTTPPIEVKTVIEEVTPKEETAEVVEETKEEVTKFFCNECGKEFASEKSLNTHIKKAHQ